MGDFLKKAPHAPQKLPQKRNRYPRKEVRTTRFLFLCGIGEFSRTRTAIQTLVCAPLAYRLLRSLALRIVCGQRRLLIHRCRGPPCLAATRSRSRSDNTPCCHSLRSRRFATHRRRLILVARRRANTVRPYTRKCCAVKIPLPTGEGFGLCVALICTPPHKRVAHFSNLLP